MHTNSPYRLVAPEPRALGLGIAGATLRAVAVAAALACSAGASLAGDATVKVTSFTVSAAEFSGNFAFAMDPFQSYNLSALEAGGALGGMTDNFAADDWNLGLNRLAQTANTKATGNTVQFTDVTTQLTTAGFNLFAQATPLYSPPALPNSANASALQSGTFVLFDGNGARTGGTITFDLFYDMSVATPGSTATNYSQTQLNVLRSSDATDTVSFADGLLSTGLSGGTGAITSGLGYVLWYAALPALTATSAAVIQLSVPAIAALGGVVLLAEPLSSRLVIASATIMGGIALTILRPRT